MGLIEHAKAEFLRAGYTPLDQHQEDGPNKWMQENVLALIEIFAKQGHSGMSAPYCISVFEKLANYKLLTPIKSIDDFKFTEVSENTCQSSVISSVFKCEKTGKAYYLDAITWRDKSGGWHGTAGNLGSSQYVKYPFTPKTFYIDVNCDDENNFSVKDESQLNEVFEYYDKKTVERS